ncbi:MAG: hypothetical protein WC601_09705 [Desulfotomaculaceae bacterium]
MKLLNSRLFLSILLVVLSALFYAVYYFFFKDINTMITWVIMSIAFLPINILIVSLVVEGVISKRDKLILLKKLNMVIGAFYSEVGTNLLKLLTGFDTAAGLVGKHMLFNNTWTTQKFLSSISQVRNSDYKLDSQIGDLEELCVFLTERRAFLLRLLENPNLLEHETFTDLLWAVFHLTEELANRRDLRSLPASDYVHISNDMKRAYKLLLMEWLTYMRHLSEDYPYLFSLAVRTNPFDPDATPEVS